ncbi:hypothetical protein ACFZAM_32010 [Streptomyces sp. NPDC008079]|uniref:hypothetical protein n=1 Tax=Streptomyces sp. NPDC008079 TaxID=3364806 RepID=UPI0036ED15A4
MNPINVALISLAFFTGFFYFLAKVLNIRSGGFGTRVSNVKRPDAELCQCEHGAAFHDAEGCRERNQILIKETVYRVDAYGVPTYNREWTTEPCRCVGYVGPNTVVELDLQYRLRPELTKERDTA